MNSTQLNSMALIKHLHRGGKFGYWWTILSDDDKPSIWWPVGNPAAIPGTWQNVYFGIHPTNTKGGKKQRSKTETVSAVNCLFAEFDIDKGATLAAVESLDPAPSVVVSSGGGWHCYWLLDKPCLIDDQNRDEIDRLQKRWVEFTGGDPGAKDLARVLRIPGKDNHKYTPPRPVVFVRANFDQLYTLGDLAACLPAVVERTAEPLKVNGSGPDIERVRAALAHLAAWRCNEHEAWVEVGFSLYDLGDDGLALWDNWSRGCPDKYQPGECARRWKSFDGQGIKIGSLFHWADTDYPGWWRGLRAPQNGGEDGSMAQPEEPEYIYPDEVLAAVPIGIIDELPQAPARKTSWTADELMTAEFPPPNWSIPEVVPEGLTILGGRPKVGKSWMALQMAWAIGSGGRCLGRQVERGKVLFLAYEDNERRLKDRMRKMGMPPGVSIRFEFSWPRLHKGGLTQLLAELERQPYRLVVIDTIARALAGLRDAESDAVYGSTYDTLQRWALSKGMSILLLDHTRKPSGYASDPVDDIMSTTTKTAISDAILALYKEQGKRGAKLMGRGRDIEDIDWDLNFDSQTACWQVDDSPYTERQSEILQALALLGKASLTELSKNIGQPKPHTLTRLNILMDSGKVKREMIGREAYFWIAQNA